MVRSPTRSRRSRTPTESRLPTREALLEYIAESPDEVTKRDLARAFRLRGRDRAELKDMLRDLQAEGELLRGRRRRMRPATRPPSAAVLEVIGTDADGELIARPTAAEHAAQRPSVLLMGTGKVGRAPAVGERVLGKLIRQDDGEFHASIIKVLPRAPTRLVGTVQRSRDGLRVVPIGRSGERELGLDPAHAEGAEPGEVVAVERISGPALGLARARVVERLGSPEDPRAISLIAAHAYDLPLAFPPEAEEQAEAAQPVALGQRADLRNIPLVTIDGPDARDFDDAVFAEPDADPKNAGGWHVIVAIADVAHYVRAADALDAEARRRGNSVYFPDRVLPMLPHALSSNLCSLRPDEDRACLAVHIWIDATGSKRRHRFVRGLMRSRARLTYEQVQAARDGAPDELTAPLQEPVLGPLFGAFQALLEARHRRGTLDLDLPEVQVRLEPETSRPLGVEARARLDSHRLIEELMVCANVCAAETLEEASAPCMYRVHDRPDPVKLEELAQLLDSLGLGRSTGALAKPKDLQRLLDRVHGHELAPMISGFILRAQSQATYSPDNLGHFGLNLRRYAHFTSPIRRYADLLVHRSLIRALRLGSGGLEEGVSSDDFREIGGWISRTERRAMEAERNAQNRFIALYMAAQIGATFPGTVASVQRFGLFVQLDGLLAEGLVPISTLGQWYAHDAGHHALIGEETGEIIALGDRVKVELTEADSLTGQLTFRLLEHTPGPAARAAARQARGRSGRRFRKRPGHR